ncbi:hypothetical protein SKAU_G00089570 [Synaphobranchus kaupii]|uniref:Uncharacterized protein n=1 Tax=Synaphobranchus kaupii TaxID=118154 RepID=A0A9Q1J602_SYNKA|nr:hypothetical protein SKAU_G00089570 [Synaphobranchus kaupii]
MCFVGTTPVRLPHHCWYSCNARDRLQRQTGTDRTDAARLSSSGLRAPSRSLPLEKLAHTLHDQERVFFQLPRTRHRVPTRSRGTAARKSASSQQRDADGGGDRDALRRCTMVFSDERRRQTEPPCSQAGGQLTVASFRPAVAMTTAHPPPVPRHYGVLTVSSAV